MSIPLKRGRFFTGADDERSPAVAVIDEAFANKYFQDKDPIGTRLFLDEETSLQIIGIVGHVKQWSLDDSDSRASLQAQLYVPFRALPDNQLPVGGVGVMVRFQDGGGEGASPFFGSVRTAI